MSNTTLQTVLLAIILVLAQVLVFNHICLFNVAVPLVFIYVIIRMPITVHTGWLLTVGFLLGFAVDICSDTYGMNTLSCTVLAMLKRPVLRLYVPREEDLSRPEPSMRSLGTAVYLKYLLSMTLVYCTLIFCLEAFTFFHPLLLALRIICSTLLSLTVMLGIDSLMTPSSEKRL